MSVEEEEMIRFEVEIEGLDNLERIINDLTVGNPPPLLHRLLMAVARPLERLYDKIIVDPSLPEKFRTSMAISVNESKQEITIGPVFEAAVLKEYGRRTEWEHYRCPKLRYLQGKLTRREEAGNYMQRIWEENRDQVLSDIEHEISDVVQEEFG